MPGGLVDRPRCRSWSRASGHWEAGGLRERHSEPWFQKCKKQPRRLESLISDTNTQSFCCFFRKGFAERKTRSLLPNCKGQRPCCFWWIWIAERLDGLFELRCFHEPSRRGFVRARSVFQRGR